MKVADWVEFVVGLAVSIGAVRWWGNRRPARRAVVANQMVAAELPFAADLLGAALQAGAAPDVAARCVGHALDGPIADRLNNVERALRLGAEAQEAWSYLGDDDGVTAIVRAAQRSQHSGAAFAGSLHRVADDLRADRLIAADAAAQRAAVLIVLPLGLCFLPAFVLAGLVPVIVAVVGDVMV